MKNKFTVLVDDNYHFMDESERYRSGSFSNLEKAIKKCEEITLRSLRDLYEEGITAEKLSAQWAMFGDDPFVVGAEEGVPFSARKFVTVPLCESVIASLGGATVDAEAQDSAARPDEPEPFKPISLDDNPPDAHGQDSAAKPDEPEAFKPIPFIGGPRHGEVWAPKSRIVQRRFVGLESADGNSDYTRKSFKTPDGDTVEFWLFCELESVFQDFAQSLGIDTS